MEKMKKIDRRIYKDNYAEANRELINKCIIKLDELVENYNYLHEAYHAEMSALGGLVDELKERKDKSVAHISCIYDEIEKMKRKITTIWKRTIK